VRVFLLSPASCRGRRAKILLKPNANGIMAARLREGTLTLGDAFSFLSGLYFRGKLTYAVAFAGEPHTDNARVLIITPTRGLLTADTLVTRELLEEFALVDIGLEAAPYRRALERDVTTLASQLPADATVVLLGSVASGKYVDVLHPLLGDRLRYPVDFIGRGDMSRGGLLLRQARAGVELPYGPIQTGERPRGRRPPKLPRETR